jgi:predicted acyl esterase
MPMSTAQAVADAIDLQGMHLTWFDRWLKGENNGADTDPPVYIFVVGANVWRSESAWPPPAICSRSRGLVASGRLLCPGV